jgi:mannose-1-phosphate guanylyltransferase
LSLNDSGSAIGAQPRGPRMKAMILAAGKGTRVRPITYSVPKPMIPLIRKPVIESLIEHLKRHGVDDIVINTSHLASSIEDYLRDGDRFGVNIAYSFEGRMVEGRLVDEPLGSAGGIKKVQDFSGFFDDTFIVLCGDALIDLDIGRLLEFHRRSGALATIALKEVDPGEVDRYGVVQTDADGRIIRFQEKPAIEEAVSSTINTGIYLFEPQIIDLIPPGCEFDIGKDLFPLLVRQGLPFYGTSIPYQWVDIGSVRDYWDATRLIMTGKVDGYQIPGREIAKGVRVGINVALNLEKVTIVPPVYIGSSTRIEDGAVITGPTVIGSNCEIEEGAVVRECIIGDYTRVRAIAELERVIVFGEKCIQPTGSCLGIDEFEIGWVVDDVRKGSELPESQRFLYELAKEMGH